MTLSPHRWAFVSSTVFLMLLVSGEMLSEAHAQSAPDLQEVYAIVKSLQARVSSLEAENRQAKREAADARAEARDLRKRLGSAPAGSPASQPMSASGSSAGLQSYAMVTKGPVAPPVPAWGGLYAGAAFGLGSMRVKLHEVETFTDISTSTFGTTTSVSTDTGSFDGAGSGRSLGAIANLFLGYNFIVAPTIVLGGQIEGGVSNIPVKLTVAGTSNALDTTVTAPGGPANTTLLTSASNSIFTDTISNRWLVSVLARGGVLVDPLDLVYVLGGWTYGRFEFGQSFGLNGGTVGAGWERVLAPGWTLRAEGRYTKFQSKTVTTPSFSTFSNVETGGGFASATTGTDQAVDASRISADMWSVWLGVTHYFN